MQPEPKVIPLDRSENIYAIQDETGKIVGTGTREVCEVMIYIVRKLRTTNTSDLSQRLQPQRFNIRAAVTI